MTRDANAISAALAAHADALVRQLLPNGRDQSGHWRVGNLDGEKGGSLAIQLAGSKQGLWIDHATGQKGNALDLVKGVRNCATREAIEWSKRWLVRNGGQLRAQAPRARDSDDVTDRIERALTIWKLAVDPRDTVVGKYLRRRALQLTDALANRVIRFDPACPWRDNETGKTIRVPAMIVAMRSINTNKITAIQRTWLSPEGQKVDRRMLGVAMGAAVKLDADCRVTNRLHIGEGVESCMAAREMGFRPTWAVGSAGAIAALPVLDGIEMLMILAENDQASARVTDQCGRRWYDAGCKVFVNRPTSGKDLNDALQSMQRSSPAASGRRRAA